MSRSTYNDNKEYELMAQIINAENGPYDETAREDITHILKLCYIYTADEGKPYEHTAADLGRAIVGYLSGGWGVPDFEKDAIEFNNPPEPEGMQIPHTPEGVHTVDTPDGTQVVRTPADDGLLIP